MFTSLSRKTTALAATAFVAVTAGTVALRADMTAPLDAFGGDGPRGPSPERSVAGKAGEGAMETAVRPGDVAVCDEPGTDEIVEVPDESAPGGEREIWVRRPPGPDGVDTPVLYLLHGSTTSHLTIREADVGEFLDKAMCEAGVQFVIAAPYGQEVGGSDTEWGDDVDGDFHIETFVTEEAVDAVEGENRRPRQLRAIGGFSMGGYGAAALALRHPDTYTQVVSWAGYFRVDDPSGTFGADTAAHAPDRLLDRPGVRDIRFMLVEGTEDRTPLQEGSIHGEAERFAGLLRERGMTVRTGFPEGGHTFETWTPTMGEAVDFLVEGWRATAERRN